MERGQEREKRGGASGGKEGKRERDIAEKEEKLNVFRIYDCCSGMQDR